MMTELLEHHFFPLNSLAGMPTSSIAEMSLSLKQGKRSWEVVRKLSYCLQHSRIGSWPVVSLVFVYLFPCSAGSICMAGTQSPQWRSDP